MSVKITKEEKAEALVLKRTIAKQERIMKRTFLAAVDKSKSALSLNELEDIIVNTNLNLALAETNNIYEDIIKALLLALLFSGEKEAKKISKKLASKITLNKDDTAISNFIEKERIRITAHFSTRQERATTAALLDGIKRGNTPRQQAKALRNSIGLTISQVKAINNYRDALERRSKTALNRALRDKRFDRTVLRSVEQKTDIEKVKINAMVRRYREKQIAYRADAIAQTEASKAVHQGADTMFNQAIAGGVLTTGQVIRTWITRLDKDVRASHDGMHGQKRAINKTFTSDDGNKLRFPHDPNAPLYEIIHCRCILVILIE